MSDKPPITQDQLGRLKGAVNDARGMLWYCRKMLEEHPEDTELAKFFEEIEGPMEKLIARYSELWREYGKRVDFNALRGILDMDETPVEYQRRLRG